MQGLETVVEMEKCSKGATTKVTYALTERSRGGVTELRLFLGLTALA